MVKRLWTLFLLLWLCRFLSGQPSQVIPEIGESARQMFDMEQHDLTYNGREYRLYIAQPAGGGQTPRPVLYMLDGNGHFPRVVNLVEEVSDNTPLIVGIGYPSPMAYPKERTRDYTVPVEGNDEGGGAEDFYRFIVDKVKPFIEANYAMDTTRQTLCGHSHGGLFTLYVMFNHTRSFQHYLAASPSIWWGEGAIVPEHRPLFSHIPHSVTITLGEYEENPGLDPSRKNLAPEILRKKEQRKGGISSRELAVIIAEEVPDCRFILFEGKNHGSSIPEFLKEAVRVAGE
ncbi:alpha/beta hydrolase-fold protein [Proteiniphilum saccharofermentans]|uniref:alpha/beta hydrolase n=1 Tax=Proteiniphilum saccharofermentans TaxID=1642647 RepID=UPI0028B178E5|nr:alpha/beta hydrolase-fold protein [Proteiniphilum saccharofermentans]